MKKTLTATLAATLLIAGIGCKPSAEKRATEAVTLTRAMDQEILDTQKKVIAKFKALPNADEIRIGMGKDFENMPMSEKNFSFLEENFEKSLISTQKNANGEALIGELHLNSKKELKNYQEHIPEAESALIKFNKALQAGTFTPDNGVAVPLNADMRKVIQGMANVMQLNLEYMKESLKITETYEVKIAKLLN